MTIRGSSEKKLQRADSFNGAEPSTGRNLHRAELPAERGDVQNFRRCAIWLHQSAHLQRERTSAGSRQPGLDPVERLFHGVGVGVGPGVAGRAPRPRLNRGPARRVAGAVQGGPRLTGAPRAQRFECRSQLPAGFGEGVLQPQRLLRVRHRHHQGVDLELTQPFRENVRCDPFNIGHKFIEATRACHERVDDEQRPAVADPVEGEVEMRVGVPSGHPRSLPRRRVSRW